MKKGIVVAFPGIRYTCGQPLVQDCLAFYKARGYETLCLDFAGVSFDGTADMSRAAEAALPSILGQLSGVCFADYTDVVFLAKSLGTLCAVRTAKALAMQPRFFLLTPLEETLQELPPDGNVFGAVVGTKDAHLRAALAYGKPFRLFAIYNIIRKLTRPYTRSRCGPGQHQQPQHGLSSRCPASRYGRSAGRPC